MAKKRKYRRSESENQIHERAVKLRKMTDEQLIHYIESLTKKAQKDGYNCGRNEQNAVSIPVFINEISTLHGIGNAITSKIRLYAAEKGYIEDQILTKKQ